MRTVLPAISSPRKQLSTTKREVCISRADSTSSRMIISALEYIARASDTRALVIRVSHETPVTFRFSKTTCLLSSATVPHTAISVTICCPVGVLTSVSCLSHPLKRGQSDITATKPRSISPSVRSPASKRAKSLSNAHCLITAVARLHERNYFSFQFSLPLLYLSSSYSAPNKILS